MRKGNFVLIACALIFVISTLSISIIMCAYGSPVIWTDKPDYAFWETVTISGSGFNSNTNITLTITRPDSVVDTGSTTSDISGNFTYYYVLNGIAGTYTVTATDGVNSASTTFTENPALLRIWADTGSYVDSDPDAWISQSWVASSAFSPGGSLSFELYIDAMNYPASNVYLAVAVSDPAQVASITVGSTTITSFTYGTVTWPSVAGDGTLPTHGVYPTNYALVLFGDVASNYAYYTYPGDPYGPYNAYRAHTTVTITTSSTMNAAFKVHFDAQGVVTSGPQAGNPDSNPFSHDLTVRGTVYIPPATVIVWKYEDADGNIATTNDWTAIDWTVHLLNGTIDQDFALGSDGTITFTGQSGSVTVTEADVAGWTHLNATSWTQTVQGGQTYIVRFVNFHNVDITVYKFEDLTGDGKTADDLPISGWTVRLYKNNVLLDTETTAADGHYTWINLGPGSYKVDEVVPASWTPTSDTSHDFGTVQSGQSYSFTFTNSKLGKISGYKWNDLNGDGFWDAGEPSLLDWTITLSGPVTDSRLTDASGYYEFTGLTAGTYTVSETLQPGWIQTMPAAPGTYTVIITSGSDVTHRNFGNFKVVTITADKWDDLDGDGVKETSEPEIPGWKLTITCPNGTTNTMDSPASWTVINGGKYTITEEDRAGWVHTTSSSVDVTVKSGDTPSTVWFGNFKLGVKGGYKSEDRTGNGPSADDTPLKGWTINLYKWDFSAWVFQTSKLTDDLGYYEFKDLVPGKYRVNETLQDGWICTYPSPPWHEFTVSSGFCDKDNNFGNKKIPPPCPVGGVCVPINKFQLLAPWISLASLITGATVSIIYVKHRKKQ